MIKLSERIIRLTDSQFAVLSILESGKKTIREVFESLGGRVTYTNVQKALNSMTKKRLVKHTRISERISYYNITTLGIKILRFYKQF